ncbi:hypothetical protein Tco_1204851, partial [Tanacetum coccineum]
MSEEDQNVEVVLPVKSDMHSYSSTMTAKDVKALAFKHNIPLDLHPVALTAEWTMDKLTDDFIGLYEQYFEFSGVRVPFSTLLLAVLDHFRVHISQLVPIGLTRLTLFELYCRSLHIVPSVNLFRVFYKIGKQGDWFTFERRVGPGSGGKILNETFSGLKGWKKRFFFLDRRAIPQAMAWRHHDSDIHDPLPTDGFRASDVVTLTNQSIDIRPVPSGLLFHAGLATTWEFSGFLPIFKDTEGNVVTMSEYLRFPFLDGATIDQGDALSARDAITSRTTGPLPVNQPLPEKTARLKEVEIPDPKIVAIRERKARAAAKKRAERKRAAGGEGGSKGKPKRRKVSAVRAEEEDSTEEASSASPLRTVAPNPSFLLKDVDDAGTAESREGEHVSVPHHDSANTTHDHTVDHDESFGESRGHGETVETHPADETMLTESPILARNPEKTVVQDLVPAIRSNLAGGHFSPFAVVTMSEYLRFPFLDGAAIEQGDALSARDAITSRTTGPLPVNQSLPEKTARLKEVEIPDPKIVAIRERKARAAAKKRAERKRAGGGEGGSKGKPKRRKVSAVRAEEEDSTEEASSASPLRTIAPNPSFLLKDVDDAGTAESREGEHVSVPHHDSANTTHDHTVDHDESFGESRGHGGTVETHPADETMLTESPIPARNPGKTIVQDLVPAIRSSLAGDPADGAESSRPGSVYVPEWTIHRRSRVDTPEECRELLTHLAPPAVREEMNAYDNNTAMERAWFSIARGAMAQTDALLRFEALYDAHLALKERCEDVTRQLVSTRTDFTHVSNLYNTLSNRYQQARGEHAGCAEKFISAERERDELRAVNADQASHIKELEAELARKDSALVFSDRISNE